jgi:hypothetical protein
VSSANIFSAMRFDPKDKSKISLKILHFPLPMG